MGGGRVWREKNECRRFIRIGMWLCDSLRGRLVATCCAATLCVLADRHSDAGSEAGGSVPSPFSFDVTFHPQISDITPLFSVSPCARLCGSVWRVHSSLHEA